MNKDEAFRELRERWFNQVIRSHAHERIWEEDAETQVREDHNRLMKAKFDKDTEAILSGEERAIAPRCLNDLGK